MARTVEQVTITVRGGPHNGLRMRGKVKDDGKVEIAAALLFFPGTTLEEYRLEGLEEGELDLVYRSGGGR